MWSMTIIENYIGNQIILPENQAAMLGRIEGVHGYGTRSARGGLYLSTRHHGSVGYRVPKEWTTVGEAQRGWRPLRLLRGGRGLGSWLSMGGLSTGWWGVGFVHGLGYLIDLAARAGRCAGAVSTYLR